METQKNVYLLETRLPVKHVINKITVPLKLVLLSLTVGLSAIVLASDDHIAPEEFLAKVFTTSLPPSNTVWITGEKKEATENILGHKPGFLRIRYWGDSARSAWIVDEIGKTEPITIGVVLNDSEIEEVKVLAFRESRGWEIKHEFFTRQFKGASIEKNHRLNRSIDGISGATLSVKAVTNVSRLVLYLAQFVSS
ncbi:MAG: FMN-binding protein [SAR86 cluster bacterium]|uniref:FMN-binding protein n=1 Tax=SAR86 cluster bacterium TaxID=2030880 RepID=A0A2A5B184_9GAMM|nr:MAG: FMN-binding protein [SAR86 cluster bacterium]